MKKIRQQILPLVFLFILGVGQTFGQMTCTFDVVAALTTGSNGQASVKIFAETLIDNAQDYTSLEVSSDGVNYGPSITLTCADIGVNVYYAKGLNNGVEESCSADLMVVDNTLPVIIALDEIFVEQGETFTVDDVDNGSFDNCGIQSSSLSQNSFANPGIYEVNYTLQDIGGNYASTTVTVTVYSIALACYDNLNAALDANGELLIYPQDILAGGPYNDDMQIFISDTGEGGDFLALDCDDIGSFAVEVQDPNNGNSCWGTLTVEDKLKPTPYAQNITVSMNGGDSVSITPELVDVGSFDNCGIATMTLSQSTFTSNGIFEVAFVVTDESGNHDFAVVAITVIGGIPTCNESIYISLNQVGEAEVGGDVFVEGNGDFDVLELSLDNVNFSETVMFDCEDIGALIPVYVHIEQDGNEYDCTSEAMIEDKLAPSVIATDFTINLDSETDTYTLEVSDIDGGSFDNCNEFTLSLSQTEFSGDDWGVNTVTLTGTDIGGNTTSAESTVTVLIDGEVPPLQCISLNASASPWGGPLVWGTDFVQNNEDYDLILISFDEAGPFTQSIIADCGVNGGDSQTVYIQANIGLDTYECSAQLTVFDDTSPVAVTKISVFLTLVNGTATLTTEMADNGSYDNCTDITLSLEQTIFTIADLGSNFIEMTVADMNGNTNSVFINVIVSDGDGCTLDFVQLPGDIEVYDDSGDYNSLSIGTLQSEYGFTYEQVHPYTVSECDGIIYTYADQVITLPWGLKVIRSWTGLDWYSGDVLTHIQVLKLFTTFETNLACNDLETVSIQNGPVILMPIDVLEGGPYNYNILTLSIVDSEDNVVVDNLITQEYTGEQLTYTVLDTETNNSCWGHINVEDTFTGCPLNENDINFPLPIIYLPEFNQSPFDVDLTPEYIANNFEYELSQVSVSWPVDECILASFTTEDHIFNNGAGNYKIVRTFTIIDWSSFNAGSTESGYWTFTQIIYTGISPDELICDILPRTAEVGDCDSGHTLSDDVEWPADLTIQDYRITPQELIDFSMVDVLDSEPSFYNNVDDYEATYVDLLVDLNTSSLVIGRVWTVTHNLYEFTWTYNQTITVDFTDFQNLVTINTGFNRAMPGVQINNTFTTNEEGAAYVEGGPVNSILYEDEFRNGVNILDFVLIQRHILGFESLTENGLLAADLNFDGAIKASDLLILKKRLLGVLEDYDWSFYEREIESQISVQPKGAYTAIKSGDVDDNALLIGDDPLVPVGKFEILDVLLNAGESYEVPVYLEDQYYGFGVEFRVDLNNDALKLIDVKVDDTYDSFDYEVTEEGVLSVVFHNFNTLKNFGGDITTPVLTLEFEAKENSLLSLAMDMDSHLSFIADHNFELVVLGGEIGDMIGTGTNSEELSSLQVYPNPASDYLQVDLKNVDVQGDMEFSAFNMNGQRIFTKYNSQTIDVSELTSGMYYYQIKIGSFTTTGKFIKMK